MTHLLESIQALHYSFVPGAESPFDDVERNCLIATIYAHRRDIAFSIIGEHAETLANAFFGVYNPRAYQYGHHKMLNSAASHEDEYRLPGVDQVYFFSSSVFQGMGEARGDRTHQNKLLDQYRVVCNTVVLGFYFTLKCWIFRFFTIRLATQPIQLLPSNAPLPPQRSFVTVRQWLDGSVHIFWMENELKFNVQEKEAKPKQRIERLPAQNYHWRTKVVGRGLSHGLINHKKY